VKANNGRRNFIAASAAVAGSAALGFPGIAASQRGKNIVVVSFGGAYQEAQRKAYYEPFAAATGIKVSEDTIPTPAKIKAMVDAKNVSWDVVEITSAVGLALFADGYLEPIDYNIVAKTDLPEQAILPGATGIFIYSWVLAFNTKHYQKTGKHPKSWADFWNVKEFPGPRGIDSGNRGITPLEFALIADGVPTNKLYPLDVERAWRSLDRIKPSVVKWPTSFAQHMQILQDGEAVMTTAASNRVVAAMRAGAPVDFVWNQGMIDMTYYAVPKGSKNKEEAMKFIAYATQAKPQAEAQKLQPGGPVNLKAFDHLTPEQSAVLSTYKPNRDQQWALNPQWWEQKGKSGRNHYQEYVERYAGWVIKRS
jgi:putative spermidine/putrescine transport system substrate-binding protein